MAVFNYAQRELTAKIVYYGPGLCGKTTNLQFVYDHLPAGVRGEQMLSLATKGDRTLFFDFLPVDLGQIHGMKTKVQLYTVPGQVFYNETRRLVLKGSDGVVFVADSQETMLDANLDSFKNLEENLSAHGMPPEDMPLVLQFNKRDLDGCLDVERLNEALNKYNAPFYEAVATTGIGVQETLRHIIKLVLLKLNEKYGKEDARQRVTSPPPAAAPQSEPSAPPAAAAVTTAAPLPDPPAAESPAPEPPSAEPIADEPAAPAASSTRALEVDAPPPQSEPAAPRAPAAAASSQDSPDVLGVPTDVHRTASQMIQEEEDVLGVAPPPSREPAGGATVRIDRGDLDGMLASAQQTRGGSATATAETPLAASATAHEVSSEDALFQESGVEPTILRAGQPQEILVPLVVDDGGETRRFRLVLRMELGRS